jgi:hypothetical protein
LFPLSLYKQENIMSYVFFQKKVDRRSRAAMVDFLAGHFRYDTMNSWNGLTSYANNIKTHRLGLTPEQSNKADEMLGTDYWDEIRYPIDDFTRAQGDSYTIGTNGRSGGYLVLYQSRREQTGHLSYCPSCGQRNFKKVPPTFQDETESAIAKEILRSQDTWPAVGYLRQPSIQELALPDSDKLALINTLKAKLADCSTSDACGVCRKPRRNYGVPPTRLMSSYKSIDQGEDFDAEDWPMWSLRERVDLVCAFDAACDQIRDNFVSLLQACDVVEETQWHPKKVKRLVSHAA